MEVCTGGGEQSCQGGARPLPRGPWRPTCAAGSASASWPGGTWSPGCGHWHGHRVRPRAWGSECGTRGVGAWYTPGPLIALPGGTVHSRQTLVPEVRGAPYLPPPPRGLASTPGAKRCLVPLWRAWDVAQWGSPCLARAGPWVPWLGPWYCGEGNKERKKGGRKEGERKAVSLPCGDCGSLLAPLLSANWQPPGGLACCPRCRPRCRPLCVWLPALLPAPSRVSPGLLNVSEAGRDGEVTVEGLDL